MLRIELVVHNTEELQSLRWRSFPKSRCRLKKFWSHFLNALVSHRSTASLIAFLNRLNPFRVGQTKFGQSIFNKASAVPDNDIDLLCAYRSHPRIYGFGAGSWSVCSAIKLKASCDPRGRTTI